MRILILFLFIFSVPAQAQVVSIGSKKFTENVILGEIAAGLAQDSGATVTHRKELGGSRILWEALLSGEIDVYPDYSGTLFQEILEAEGVSSLEELRPALARYGVAMTDPLGFNNSYAVGLLRTRAQGLGLEKISDLNAHADLALGFSNEFMDRGDGWPALRQSYSLVHENVRGVDHDLGYRALQGGSIDVKDLYTTDAEIAAFDLVALEDDQGHFPRYDALFLYRVDLADRAPNFVTGLNGLAGRITAPKMIAMNKSARIDRLSEEEVAQDFLKQEGVSIIIAQETMWDRLGLRTLEHLRLVALSLGLAIIIAIPLGILAYKRPRTGTLILGLAGLMQTIPALALFVVLIPLLGIGAAPAIAALFLYSILPIIRNSHAGLNTIAQGLLDSADAMGLPATARMRHVELPLALPMILAGVKTAAVINVGLATLGAIIGAGGYGQPILTGIRLNDTTLILEGAIPAALMAVGVERLLHGLEILVRPKA